MYKVLLPVAVAISGTPLLVAALRPAATTADYVFASVLLSATVGLVLGNAIGARQSYIGRSELADLMLRDAQAAKARHEKWKAPHEATRVRRDEEALAREATARAEAPTEATEQAA